MAAYRRRDSRVRAVMLRSVAGRVTNKARRADLAAARAALLDDAAVLLAAAGRPMSTGEVA